MKEEEKVLTGIYLKRLRIMLGNITQESLAKSFNTKHSHISHIERNKHGITLGKFLMIAKLYNFKDFNTLFNEEEWIYWENNNKPKK